ncbi:MAG TPA: CoA-binding protein [Thermoleophilia bacterium]|nr:CoA-binding protein [Thermoleophilia bacterium]
MPSTREDFWALSSYAVIGDSSGGRKFPQLTYRGLKRLGKTVLAVDPGASEIEGDRTYPDLASLPQPVEAAVLEVAKQDAARWMETIVAAGIPNVWVHQSTETPEALQEAEGAHLRCEHGTCAVMYVTPGFTGHSFHRWVMKLAKKY